MYELCFVSGFITVAVFFLNLLANGKLNLNKAGKIIYACIFVLVVVFYYLLLGTVLFTLGAVLTGYANMPEENIKN